MLDVNKLDELIKNKNLTNIAISKTLESYGIIKGEATIRKYRHGINDPDTKTLSILADILDVSEQDFFVGSEKRKEKIASSLIQQNPLKYKHYFDTSLVLADVRQIKLINSDKPFIYIDNSCIGRVNEEDELFGYIVQGDSMSPYVNDKDIAIFKKITSQNQNDGKYIITTKVGFSLKNLKFLVDGRVQIISQNKTYNIENTCDECVKKEEIEIVGEVVARILKG